MKIAVLGSGMVGQALSRGLVRHGHDVVMGTRDPAAEKLVSFVAETPGVTARTYGDAAAGAELAILCVGWSGAESAINLAGPSKLAGKVVIDVTNPLAHDQSGPKLALGFDDSAGEQVQRWLPEAKVVKALNILTAANMIDPSFSEGTPTMFIAGNDEDAKATVCELLGAWGWSDTRDVGDITGSRLLEALAMLWIRVAIKEQHFDQAFALLRG